MTSVNKNKISQLDDEELVALYQECKEKALFDEIYERFSGRVYGKCLTFFQNEHVVQDCVQEIFMKLLVSIGKFKRKSKFSTWLYSITYNYCVDRTRKDKRNHLDLNEEIADDVDNMEDVEDKELLEMELEQLEQSLELIPTKDKAILLMKYLDEMKIKDIAKSIEKSESAVKMQIKRAKIKCVNAHRELFGERIIRT